MKDILEVSYSFPPPEIGTVTEEMRSAGVRRVLRKVRVLEGSMCLRGAGINTGVVGAKCSGCGQPHTAACSCAPKQKADPAAMKESLALYERNAALLEALREPYGAIAVDAAETITRWSTLGRLDRNRNQHPPPVVRFFSDHELKQEQRDGRTGYFDPSRPNEIHVRRGLSLKETILVIAHEIFHYTHPWERDGEDRARINEKYLGGRYLENHFPSLAEGL